MILLKISNVLLPSALIVFVFFNLSLSAQDTSQTIKGKLYIGFNKEPDSLYLDGSKVSLSPNNILEVDTGFHKIDAYLTCFNTISKTINVKKHRIHPVRLKFKHLTTPEYDSYKFIRLSNYTARLLTIGASSLFEGGISTLLPIGIIGLTGQIFWQMNQSSYFNHCSGEYNNPRLKKSANKLFFGINSRFSSEYSIELNDSFNESYQTPYAIVGVKRYLKKKIIISPNDAHLSSYSLFMSYQRQFYQNYHIALHTNIFPNFITRAELYDEHSLNCEFKNPNQTLDRKDIFFIIGLDLDYKIYDSLNYSLYFSVGGFLSNTISENIALEVMHPSLNYFDDNPPLTYLNYSYSASGGSLGIRSVFSLNNALSFSMLYKLYFTQVLELNTKKRHNILANISANLVYNF